MKRTEKETDTEGIINKDKLSGKEATGKEATGKETNKESGEAGTDHNMMKKRFKK